VDVKQAFVPTKTKLLNINNMNKKTEAQMLREYFAIRNARLKLIAASLRDEIYLMDVSQAKAKRIFAIAEEIEKEAGNE